MEIAETTAETVVLTSVLEGEIGFFGTVGWWGGEEGECSGGKSVVSDRRNVGTLAGAGDAAGRGTAEFVGLILAARNPPFWGPRSSLGSVAGAAWSCCRFGAIPDPRPRPRPSW